jgi:hypothetical protein
MLSLHAVRLLMVSGLGGVLVVLSLGAPTPSAGAQAVDAGSSNCPVLQVDSPGPGDFLPSGDHLVSGTAFDPAAADGGGVTRVDLFLGHRESGGVFLGSAVPGQSPTGNPRVFQTQVSIPRGVRSGDFVAYAYSSISGGQTSVAFPVQVGTEPTATPRDRPGTPVLPSVTMQSTCPTAATCAGQPASNVAPLPNQSTPVPIQPQPEAAPANQLGPVLQLANPSAGDLLATGASVVSGVAFDPASTQGPGIDRVDLFLDSRDSGGIFLGGVDLQQTSAFQVTITVARKANGAHDLVAYAHSTVTGTDVVTSIPVFFGTRPK